MRSLSGSKDIEAALQAVGELVASAGARYRIVIVGGAALNLLGVVARTTVDVDILAFATSRHKLTPPPSRLPEPLARAIRTVAADFGLGDDWLNTGPPFNGVPAFPAGWKAESNGAITAGSKSASRDARTSFGSSSSRLPIKAARICGT